MFQRRIKPHLFFVLTIFLVHFELQANLPESVHSDPLVKIRRDGTFKIKQRYLNTRALGLESPGSVGASRLKVNDRIKYDPFYKPAFNPPVAGNSQQLVSDRRQRAADVMGEANRYVEAVKAASQKVQELGSYKDKLTRKEIELPFGVSREIAGKAYTIIIDSIVLTPRYAYAVIYCEIDNPEQGRNLYFAARDVRFTRDGGFTGDAELYLLRNYKIDFGEVAALEFISSVNRSCYVKFNCDGFQELHIEADIWFSPEHFLQEMPRDSHIEPDLTDEESAKILAKYNSLKDREVNESYGDDNSFLLNDLDTLKRQFSLDLVGFDDIFIAIEDLPKFQVKGLKDFTFDVGTIVVDYSTFKHQENTGVFRDYEHPRLVSDSTLWKGIILTELEITLPEAFNKNKEFSETEKERISLGVKGLIVDDFGFTGELFGKNLIQVGQSDLEGWAFTLDELKVGFKYSEWQYAGFNGTIGTPITREGLDDFNYDGLISKDNGISLTVSTTDEIEFEVFKAGQVRLGANSSVTLEYHNKKLKPSANLNGSFTISTQVKKNEDGNMNDPGGKGFSLPEVTFQNLTVTGTKPYLTGGSFGLGNPGSLANLPITVTKFELKEPRNDNEVGLNIVLAVNLMKSSESGFSASGDLDIVAKILPNRRIAKYRVHEVKVNQLDLAINNEAFSLIGKLQFFRDDITYGQGFNAEIDLKLNKIKVEVSAKALFGKASYSEDKGDTTKNYRYWYVDARAGFPAIMVVPNAFGINAFGGALYYQMGIASEPVESDYGQSRSGISYVPDSEKGLGVKALIGIQGATPETFSGDVALELLFNKGGGLAEVLFSGYIGFAKPPQELSDAEKEAQQKEKVKSFGNDAAETPKGKSMYEKPVSEDRIGQILSQYKVGVQWLMRFDFNNNIYSGFADAYINVSDKVRGDLNEYGKVGGISYHFSDDYKYVWIGNPAGDNLSMLLSGWTAKAYLVMGDTIPPVPELSELGIKVPEGIDASMGIKGAVPDGGIAFGVRVGTPKEQKRFLMLYAEMKAEIGFDIQLANFSAYRCAHSGESPGINGWYASGRIYAKIDAEPGVRAKVFGKERKLPLGQMVATAVLLGKAPKPSYFAGFLNLEYNLLGGLVKGKNDLKFAFGETCELIGNPLEGIDIITDIAPEGGNNVSVFAQPEIAFSFPVNRVFKLDNMETDEPGDSILMRLRIEHLSVKLGSVQAIDFAEEIWHEGGERLKVIPRAVLSGESNYSINVTVAYDRYFPTTGWSTEGSQSKSVRFKTGVEPGYIPLNTVAYSYPLPNMKNFYIDEYRGEGYVRLKQDRTKPFLLDDNFYWERRWYQGDELVYKLAASPKIIMRPKSDQYHIRYNIPYGVLEPNTSYDFVLVKVPKVTKTTASSSVEYTEVDLEEEDLEMDGLDSDRADSSFTEIKSNKLEGVTSNSEEVEVLRLPFRTSSFRTFKSHYNAFNQEQVTMATNGAFGQKMYNSENFSNAQLNGYGYNYTGDKFELVTPEATNYLTSPYTREYLNPVLYEQHSHLINRSNKNKVGESNSRYIPYKHIYFRKAGNGKPEIMYYAGEYVHQDYTRFRDKMVRTVITDLNKANNAIPKYVGEIIDIDKWAKKINEGVAESDVVRYLDNVVNYQHDQRWFQEVKNRNIGTILQKGYKVPFKGNYNVRLSYRLPGGISRDIRITSSLNQKVTVTQRLEDYNTWKNYETDKDKRNDALTKRNETLDRLDEIEEEENLSVGNKLKKITDKAGDFLKEKVVEPVVQAVGWVAGGVKKLKFW